MNAVCVKARGHLRMWMLRPSGRVLRLRWQHVDALGVCGGPCVADIDGDGVCDMEEVSG